MGTVRMLHRLLITRLIVPLREKKKRRLGTKHQAITRVNPLKDLSSQAQFYPKSNRIGRASETSKYRAAE